MRTARCPRDPVAKGLLRRLLGISTAVILASAAMTGVLAGPASAGTLPSGGPICLANYPTTCLVDYDGNLWATGIGNGQAAQNWYTEYIGQTEINGHEWNDYYISANNSFGSSSLCIDALNSLGFAACGSNGTAWVWSADANGNDLVSRYYLNNGGNYYDIFIAALPGQGNLIGAELGSYGSGYWRWAEE
jgi:hypothetical protein